jgi:hypothetical protein
MCHAYSLCPSAAKAFYEASSIIGGNKREERAKKVAANKAVQACIYPHYKELMAGLACV